MWSLFLLLRKCVLSYLMVTAKIALNFAGEARVKADCSKTLGSDTAGQHC